MNLTHHCPTPARATSGPLARPRSRSHLLGWALVVCLLVAWGVRVADLGGPSYWGDEMVTVTVARLPLLAIPSWVAENDPHPPLYYLLAHLWLALVGESEFATRALSLGLGVLALPLAGVLTRRLLGVSAALVVIALFALNPLQVAQSRDARMYPLVVATTLAATLVLWQQYQRPTRPGWLAYVLLAAASLYSHYYGGLVLLGHGLFVLSQQRARPHFLRQFSVAGLATLLLYLPWLVPGLVVIGAYEGYGWSTGERGIGSWPAAVGRCLQVFLTGPWTPSDPWQLVVSSLAAVLTLAGLVVLWQRQRAAAVLLALVILVPISVVYLASLQRPLFTPKYLIVAEPAVLVAMGALVAVPRLLNLLALLALGGVLALQLAGVVQLRTDPAYANADWRAAARFVAARERPGDGIVYGHDGMKWLFGFYHPARGGELVAPFVPATERRAVEELLHVFTRDHARVWVVPWWNSDTDVAIERWLTANAYLTLDRWIDRQVRILLFASGSDRPPSLQPTSITFGELVRLDGWTSDRTSASQGDILRLDLRWTALDDLDEELRALVVLLDAQGHRIAQRDRAPRNAPTTGWPAGQRRDDRIGLLVPPGTRAGDYTLAVGLYRASDGGPLLPDVPTRAGLVPLGQVTITPDQPPFDPAAVEADWQLLAPIGGGIRLVGVSYAPGPRRQGDLVSLTTFWQATEARARAPIRLGVGPGPARTIEPGATGLPVGAIERFESDLRIAPTLPPGRYDLWAEGPAGRLLLGQVTVVAAPALPSPAPPAQRLNVRFGDVATLLGATVHRAAGATEVRLLWRADREVEEPLAVFVHLVASDGRILAQSDGIPAGGAAPSSRWTPGFEFEDRHQLPSSQPGQIIVGLYNPLTLRRVPTESGEYVLLPATE